MFRQTLVATLMALGVPFSAWGQDCPVDMKVIEELPYFNKGNNCGSGESNVLGYQSPSCLLPGDAYRAAETVYELRLHEGNQVSFLVTPLETVVDGKVIIPDLVLAVLNTCGDGTSCASNSADFIGPDPEEISAVKYTPGVYYLNVDSAGPCGDYQLSVFGTNPTPKFDLEMNTGSLRAKAGTPFTYNFTVGNRGGQASRVVLEHSLPSGTKAKSYSDGCSVESPEKVVCKKQDSDPFPWTVSVTVEVPAQAEGRITSSATVSAAEGRPAVAKATTVIDHVHDLSIHMAANEAIAGKIRTYTLTLKNDGPSDAKAAKVVDTLDDKEQFKQGEDCVEENRNVVCTVDLKAKSTETRKFTVLVRSSATALSNRATIRVPEGSKPDPKPGDNEARLDTLVSRETDLLIVSVTASREDPEQSGPIAAGAHFAYAIKVRNAGPSDSSGGTVTLSLPEYLTFRGSTSLCLQAIDPENHSLLVTCDTLLIDAGDEKTVKFSLETSPGLGSKSFRREAEVAARETDPVHDNSKPFDTEIVVEADLRIMAVELTDSVCEGNNFLYTMTVLNEGPSDSSAGTITGVLDGLSLVASPDDCSEDSSNHTVTCAVGDLAKGDDKPIQFRAAATRTGTVKNTISAQGENHPGSDAIPKVTTVVPTSDLGVVLRASDAPLIPGQDFTYTVEVTNHGPSKAADVKVKLKLPVGVTSEPREGCDTCASPCTLNLGDIETDGPGEARSICAHAPAGTGEIKAEATLLTGSCDPNSSGNNMAANTTTVATEGDADLVLTMMANKEAVSVGDILMFSLRVLNQGIATAEGVKAQVTLPDGLCLGSEEPCVQTFLYTPDALERTAERSTTFTARVIADGPILETTATVSSNQSDPNTRNNESKVFTQRAAPLVVPFVEVNADAAHPTTIFTLKNPSETDTLDINYNVFFTDPATDHSADPIPGSLLDLPARATATVDLLGLDGLEGKGLLTGHVEISPESGSPSGDFTRVDSAEGTASGERLISTATDLCERWSVRFLNGQPADSSTELLFFVPDNPGGQVATGRVLTESGAFVKDVTVTFGREAYSYRLMDVPEGSGSIEWTFTPGLVGSITAIHRFRAGDEVAVPGFCRRPGHPGAQSLILPFFQADAATNTYVAVRNETDEEVAVDLSYLDEEGERKTKTISIARHAVWTANLRSYLSVETGFLEIEAFRLQDDTGNKLPVEALSGDFIRIGPGGLAGSALVERPAGLCSRWDTRFVQDIEDSKATRFLVYVEEQGAPPAVTAYNDGGDLLDVTPPNTNARSFLVSASDLGLNGSGSVEWNFDMDDEQNVDDRKGFVAMLLSGEGPGGKYSVLIPGACRDEEPPLEE